MEIASLLPVINRRKWIILISTAIVVISTIMSLKTKETFYTAAAKILVQEAGTQQYMYPSARGKLSLIDAQQSEVLLARSVETQIEIIKSKKIMTPALKKLKYKGKGPSRIQVGAIRQTDIISIVVEANHPEDAMNIANSIAKTYIEWSKMSISEITKGTVVFLERQLEKQKQILQSAEEDLSRFKKASGIVAMDSETQGKLRKLTDYETEREKTKIELQSISERIQELRSSISKEEETIISSVSIAENPAISQLQNNLNVLEIKYIGLISKFEEKHPEVVSVKDQIDEIKNKLQKEVAQIVISKQETKNPLKQNMMAELSRLEAENISLQAKLFSYSSIVALANKEVLKLPDKEIEFVRLTRARQVAENIYMLIQDRYQDLRITQPVKLSPSKLIEAASMPSYGSAAKQSFPIILAIIIGIAIGCGVAFLIEYLDDTIYSSQDLKKFPDIKIIGILPKCNTEPSLKICEEQPNSLISDAFRRIKNKLLHLIEEQNITTMAITSPSIGEGKSTIAANLAVSFAEEGIKTMLIDLDLKKPSLWKIASKNNLKGVTDILIAGYPVEDYILDVGIDNLKFLPAGNLSSTLQISSTQLLKEERTKNLFGKLKSLANLIIIDTPPILRVGDVLAISKLIDSIILCVSYKISHLSEVQKALEEINEIKINLLGIIINRGEEESLRRYRYYYYR